MSKFGSVLAAAALALFACGWPAPSNAHDVADDLRLHAFVTAHGDRLQVVLRVPLELMLNVDLPKRGNGYLDLAAVDEAAPRALQAVTRSVVFTDGGRALELADGQARIALPSDRTFESFERARDAVRGERLPAATDVYWNQGYFDALLEYRRDGTRAPDLAVDLRFGAGLRDRLRLDLRWLTADGRTLAYELPGGSGPVTLDPRWHQAAASFVQSGLRHILGGVDHLLFLLCLVLPFRRLGWPLVGVVTAFTVGHSITLAAAALGLVPREPAFALLVEALIAASIVVMAIDNLLGAHLHWRWALTAAFGLLHGFAFSFALAHELQFAGEHLALSLLMFNVGIEIGQLVALALTWPLLNWAMSRSPSTERVAMALICGFVIHQAWHWLMERFSALQRADWQSLAAELWPVAAIGSLLAFALWALAEALRRRHIAAVTVRR